jgi:hypothetical protein
MFPAGGSGIFSRKWIFSRRLNNGAVLMWSMRAVLLITDLRRGKALLQAME